MTSYSEQQRRLDLIRDMERAGCDIVTHADPYDQECSVTVYWRGWQTTVIRLCVFDFDRAHTEWTEYRDSMVYRVMSHQDQPRSAVRPQERRRRSKRVLGRAGVATPDVAKAVAQRQGRERGAA